MSSAPQKSESVPPSWSPRHRHREPVPRCQRPPSKRTVSRNSVSIASLYAGRQPAISASPPPVPSNANTESSLLAKRRSSPPRCDALNRVARQRRNEVIPAPSRSLGRIETQYTVRQRVTQMMIKKQPAVQLLACAIRLELQRSSLTFSSLEKWLPLLSGRRRCCQTDPDQR